MTTEEVTVAQRIVQLESALVIAESHSDILFAKRIKDQIEWLKNVLNRHQECFS
jgi:hypothetical protein